MTPMQQAKKVLAEVEQNLTKFIWRKEPTLPAGVPDKTTAYQGDYRNMSVVVVRFDIEPQGFPPGSFGYDGALRADMMVVRMPRDLAEKCFRQAERSLP